MFRRKPRITDSIYGNLMTSFGRVVDLDPFVARPAEALAEKVAQEQPDAVAAVDARLYSGAAFYHLRLLAGSWIMSQDGIRAAGNCGGLRGGSGVALRASRSGFSVVAPPAVTSRPRRRGPRHRAPGGAAALNCGQALSKPFQDEHVPPPQPPGRTPTSPG